MTTDFSATIERFSGYADLYDRYRPAPPEALADVLCRLAQTGRPELVVDLGCGSGLSTRFWAGHAAQVIGFDPSSDMLRVAAARTPQANVAYRSGLGHATGLPDGYADIITCSQSFHWMEPASTLAEVARLLRPGGVFAACDHDSTPLTPDWRIDLAYTRFREHFKAVEKRRGVSDGVPRWDKSGHLDHIRDSGHFRYEREIVLHHIEMGNAGRLVGFAMSQGSVETLLKAGLSEEELGLDALKAEASRLLGDEPQPWYWLMRVRVGVK